VILEHLSSQLLEIPIKQMSWSRQGVLEWPEVRLARRQLLTVAYELEARIDGITNHIGDIVQIQRGKVTRAILSAEGTERPSERIIPFVDG